MIKNKQLVALLSFRIYVIERLCEYRFLFHALLSEMECAWKRQIRTHMNSGFALFIPVFVVVVVVVIYTRVYMLKLLFMHTSVYAHIYTNNLFLFKSLLTHTTVETSTRRQAIQANTFTCVTVHDEQVTRFSLLSRSSIQCSCHSTGRILSYYLSLFEIVKKDTHNKLSMKCWKIYKVFFLVISTKRIIRWIKKKSSIKSHVWRKQKKKSFFFSRNPNLTGHKKIEKSQAGRYIGRTQQHWLYFFSCVNQFEIDLISAQR